MRKQTLLVIIALAIGSTACGQESYSVNSISDIGTPSDPIFLRSAGHPDAKITSSGDLIISGKNIDVIPDQKTLLRKYYVTAQMMKGPHPDPSTAKVRAGESRSVAQSSSTIQQSNELANNDESGINQMRSQAKLICADLANLKANQARDLRGQIVILQSYTLTTDEDVTSCVDKWH
ncbi:hypothetical protein B0E46_14275 [Rhodanobacter sp. B04]|uniref:hypothetical protein n=1 Tax=Rhodanobacter sp. B04 TaxID=1945860 RepID=UPI0009843580|nr:hypothetical protein [Rhodanobacter sp. B04]OOG61855.1 hypothetical protein B0E46_14275 [Rhodanobacter sp. B04]